jgi:transposase-like protein
VARRERREYTDHEKANALALLAVSRVEDVHAATGIPLGTLKDWKRKPPRGALELQPEKEASLADELRHAARALVGAIPSKIADAPLNHTAIALGIIFDKLQLLEGKPTSIDEVRDALSDDDRAARVAALLDRARARRTGLAN